MGGSALRRTDREPWFHRTGRSPTTGAPVTKSPIARPQLNLWPDSPGNQSRYQPAVTGGERKGTGARRTPIPEEPLGQSPPPLLELLLELLLEPPSPPDEPPSPPDELLSPLESLPP